MYFSSHTEWRNKVFPGPTFWYERDGTHFVRLKNHKERTTRLSKIFNAISVARNNKDGTKDDIIKKPIANA